MQTQTSPALPAFDPDAFDFILSYASVEVLEGDGAAEFTLTPASPDGCGFMIECFGAGVESVNISRDRLGYWLAQVGRLELSVGMPS
jgi:hypothetical protein